MNLLKSKLLILVCLAINHTQKNIAFPDNASDLREIKRKLHDIGKIPNCVGAVDGTLNEWHRRTSICLQEKFSRTQYTGGC